MICTQVLGAIPVSDISWVIDRLYSLANKALYISERLGDARKVLGDNDLRPTNWDANKWARRIDSVSAGRNIEVTLATRAIVNGEKITSHLRSSDDHLFYQPVIWPPGIRAMNHKWTPHA